MHPSAPEAGQGRILSPMNWETVNIQKKGYEMMTIPVDGGESTPVETNMVDDRANAPKKPNVEEAGIVLENTTQEAPCL